MAALGIALSGALMLLYHQLCTGTYCCKEAASGLCWALTCNPPWTVLAALTAAPAAVLTWYWRTSHRKTDIDHTAERLFTDRFAKAVELLGSDQLPARLGAIYALERLARDSERDRYTTAETLAAFVRDSAGICISAQNDKTEESDETVSDSADFSRRVLQTDVRAGLTVLSRLNACYDIIIDLNRINLARTSIGDLDPRDTNLTRVGVAELNFSNANLHHADLSYSDLLGISLSGAQLSRASLIRSQLVTADLSTANLDCAKLSGADLSYAILGEANLRHANLERANLSHADLSGANLSHADLGGAHFTEARLCGANLRGTLLTATMRHDWPVNFNKAQYTTATTWPNGFDPKAAGAILVDDDGNPVDDESDAGEAPSESVTK